MFRLEFFKFPKKENTVFKIIQENKMNFSYLFIKKGRAFRTSEQYET